MKELVINFSKKTIVFEVKRMVRQFGAVNIVGETPDPINLSKESVSSLGHKAVR